MKLPKLFGRKKGDDDEDDEDDLDEEMLDIEDLDDHVEKPSSTPAAAKTADDDRDDVSDDVMVGGPSARGGDHGDDEDYDDEDDDDDEAEESGAKRKAILFAAVGAGVLLLSGVGGAAYWFFSGPDTPAKPAHTAAANNDPREVEMSMPPPPASAGAGGAGAPSLNQLLASGGATASAPVAESKPAPVADSPAAPAAEAPAAPAAAPEPAAPASLNSLNAMGSADAGGGVVVPAVAQTALAKLPDQPTVADQSQALSSAPVRALIESIDGVGDLPKVGNNGSKSSTAYARPFDASGSLPKVAILIEGIGLSRQASLAAINKLPPQVSMILSPYGRDLDDWVFRSRLAGHEVFLSLPMESEKFPLEDGGPLALDTRVQVAENKRRLDAVMASAGGYVGFVTYLGSRFLKAEGQIRELLKITNSRGLMFIIGGRRARNDATQIAADLGIPRAETEFYLDETPAIQEIRTSLDKAVSLAKDKGSVLVIARPYPVTIKSIVDWTATLKEAGVTLAPASAIAAAAHTQ